METRIKAVIQGFILAENVLRIDGLWDFSTLKICLMSEL